MARRVSLPAADDLFRPTGPSGNDVADAAAGKPQSSVRAVPDSPDPGTTGSTAADEAAAKRASGRVRHDEKMTVYVTSEELLDVERTRLELRGVHGLAIDRGRLVREALDAVLADFHEHGEDSILVRRLLDSP